MALWIPTAHAWGSNSFIAAPVQVFVYVVFQTSCCSYIRALSFALRILGSKEVALLFEELWAFINAELNYFFPGVLFRVFDEKLFRVFDEKIAYLKQYYVSILCFNLRLIIFHFSINFSISSPSFFNLKINLFLRVPDSIIFYWCP
jgi:hypothetical protein